jgi:glycosyltransferase involved in cell wall biosynthesis
MKNSTPRAAIIYHFFPHYRAPVLRALRASRWYDFEFWGAKDGIEGIKPFAGDEHVEVKPLTCKVKGSRIALAGYWRPVVDRKIQTLVILGNPNIHATWLMAAVGRACGKKIFFWSHGWLRSEAPLKQAIRNLYFSLSDGVLVYADRARTIAESSGFPAHKVHPIYNSLDWDVSCDLYEQLSSRDEAAVRAASSAWPEVPLLICTARLTELCRFDLLLDAMSRLQTRGCETSLILVGDGPERRRLEQMARELNLNVTFTGAIYDEAELARLIYASDLTVSPGKVGLTAMHSLTYGTPVITHGDLDSQMPEVEAIRPGITGDFFRKDDAEDLARAIADWLSSPRDRRSVRERCREMIRERYTPAAQVKLIEAALDGALGRQPVV